MKTKPIFYVRRENGCRCTKCGTGDVVFFTTLTDSTRRWACEKCDAHGKVPAREPAATAETAREVGRIAGEALKRALQRCESTLEKCKAKFTEPMNFGSAPVLPPPSAPAAQVKPHPLQRLVDQPSPFGQSMWRPWEK